MNMLRNYLTLILTGAAVALAVVIGFFRLMRTVRKTKVARLSERRPLTADEFFANFYLTAGLSKQDVVALRAEIASAIEVPVGLLRPEDRFSVELADCKGMGPMDGGLAELTFSAERRKKTSGRDLNISTLKSVDDYIRAFARPDAIPEATQDR